MMTLQDAGAVAFPTLPSSLLIIEDAPVHRAVIGRVADKIGFEVTRASSYEDACEMLDARRFDCITLDLGLGDHVGLDVLRHLSAIRCRARIIVISQSDKDVCEQTVQLGRALDLDVYESVPKPIDLLALRELLARILLQLRPDAQPNG